MDRFENQKEHMNCPFCKGELEARLIRYVQDYKGKIVVIDNVPADVCTQCSEPLIRPDIAERVQQIVWGKLPNHKVVQAESYDFADVA